MEQLKRYLNREGFIKLDSFKGKAGMRVLGVEANFSLNEKSVVKTLFSGKKPLLLVLDEAQHLKKVSHASFEIRNKVEKVLDELHNGGFDKPLV